MVRASLIRKLEDIEDPKLRDVLISFLEEAERIIGETVTRKEFQEFVATTNENFDRVWKAIGKLTEAQIRTEERLDKLTQRVDKLTERVDKLTERVDQLAERMDQLAQRMEELAEAQKKTEERLNKLTERVDKLTERVDNLAERMDQLAQRMDELAEAQKKTEERLETLAQRVDELAQAQKKTEEKLEKLIGEHKKTREHLGGLSNAFGYVLEDRAIRGIPAILMERFNMEIIEPLRRDFIETPDGRPIEVNLLGRGKINGKELTIIGECKAQLRKRDVDKFLNYVKMLDRHLPGEKFLVVVTYQTPLQVRKYIKEKGINLVFSYELPL